MSDLMELAEHLKKEVETLKGEKNRLEGEIVTSRESASRVISDAEKKARKIVEEAESQAQAVDHRLRVREESVKKSEGILKQLESEAKQLEETKKSLDLRSLDISKRETEAIRTISESATKRQEAESYMERVHILLTEKGLKLEDVKSKVKEPKKESVKKD